MPRNVAPALVEPPEPLERVQERLWFALPSIVALRTAESKGPERPAPEPQPEDSEPPAAPAAEAEVEAEAGAEAEAEAAAVEDPLATALVPFAEVQQAAECLFVACHRNPVAADVAAGVSALLGPPDENSERMYGRADIAQLLLDVATHWLEWADKERTWRAVSERQFASAMKELVDCVTHDTPPGALLPVAQVLTARSDIARTKSLVTPFEAFVELATPPEFPAIYDTLWSMLCPSPDAEFITEASFVVFFRWFYLRVFCNATEASAGAAAVPVWHAFLDARGQMGRRQFVAACRHMCRLYAQRDDVACLEAFYRETTTATTVTTTTTEEYTKTPPTEGNTRAEFFASRAAPLGRVLANPHDLFVPEELDVARREAARLAPEHSANRIIVCGRRGVGKSALCAALARRLRGVDLSAAALAAEAAAAAAKDSTDPLGAQLRAHVAAGTVVPLALRAALIRRRLSADDVAHKGYAFSDFPACPAGDGPVEEEEVRAFFEECGIFDVALPTAIVYVQCDDEALYAERLADAERLTSAARAREDELRALIAADTERTARVEELRAAVRLGAEMSSPPPAALVADPAATAAGTRKKSARTKRKGAPATVTPDPAALAAAEEAAAAAAAAEEELARVRAAAAAELARLGEVDGLLSRGGEGDEAENSEERAAAQQREATRRAERAAWEAEVFQLTLRRLMDAVPGTEAVGAVESVEGLATGAAPIAAMDAQLRPLGRCVSLDCTSTAEEAVAYIVEALQMRPCILPRDLAAAQEEGGPDGDKDLSSKGEGGGAAGARRATTGHAGREGEEAAAGEREENAAKMGAIPSDVWKRYCPVTFADYGVLVEGTALYGCVYCQRVYYTASAECLERFLADPPRYLRATPLDGAPIFLLSTIDTRDVPSRLPSDLVDALITRIFEQLKLTSMSFSDFTAAWDRHRGLREKRAQTLKDRELYEMRERPLRAERLKKRLVAEMKAAKKKKKQPQAPKGKQRKGTAIVEIPDVEEKYTGWDASADEAKALSSRIQKRVNASIERRRTFVPILVHAIGPDFSREAFDLLLAEGVLPETVVVLDYARPTADDGEAPDDEHEGGEEEDQQQQQGDDGLPPESGKGEGVSDVEGQGDGTTENVTKVKPKRPPPMPQIAAIKEIERRVEEAGEERRDEKDEAENLADRPHRFRVHRFAINDKTADILVGEILQAICPAMPRIEAGAVDEELGEDDDASNEDEDEFYDDDEEENEGTPRGGGPLVVVDRAVRPGKRFLNQFGSRLQYCPVTLYEKGLLMKGRNEHCAKYRQELYVFTTEEAQAKFERHPLRYLENPVPYIPPRIWVVGYSYSGKKTLMRHLSEVYDVPCFAYDRGFFERVIEAARTPGGAYVNDIKIPEAPADHASLVLAEEVLKGVRDFAQEQERHLQLREAAEAEMERRRLAEERVDDEEEENEEQEEEKDEVDEEAEALLQEQLDFEPETDEDRGVRLSESYLKIASCVTRFEPFASRGYIMVCPPFSEGDLEVLFTAGGVPEVALQIDLTPESYRARNRLAEAPRRSTRTDQLARSSHAPLPEEVEEDRQAERALHKWRRRHIGADDPDSEVEETNETDHVKDGSDNATRVEDASEAEQLLDANQAVEQEAISEFAEAISDLLVPVVVINGDLSKNAIYRAAKRQLFKVLEHRRSILHVAEVYRYEDALRMLETGEADLSYFDYTDPVRLYDARHGVRRECKWCPDGVLPPPEEDPNAAAAAAEGAAGTSVEDKTRERNGGDKKASAATEDDDDEEDEEEREESSRPLLSQAAAAQKTNDEEDEDEEMSEYGSEEMDEARDAIERARRRERLRHYQRVALFCGRFYFFDDDASLARFLRDPLLFTMAPPPPPPPAARAVVAVVDVHAEAKRRGPAEHLALNLGCPLVSLPKLLSWAAVQAPRLLSLARRAIDAVLRGRVEDDSGEDVTDALIGELLAHRLAGADVRRRGAVLLNLPRTAAQYDRLLKANVRIDKVAAFGPQSPLCGMAVQAMRATAAVDAPAQEPRGSVAALAALMGYVDEFVSNEGCAALCRIRAIPMNIHNTYYTAAHVETHLSPYGWFCPYSWVLCESLIDQRESQKYGAEYLGVFYFFSRASYLKRFLATPAEVIDAPGFRAIPEDIPVRIPFSEGMTFELLGCCPVTLYDTRENKGLRSVVEPLAREGSHTCIVQYKGKNYALLDELLLERFMLRPWQYVAGAALPPPRKQPLQAPATLFSIDEEQYIRRTLYDPVAYALTAVMADRPKYPGLSLEESALKYVALHMKCHNEKNTAIQAEQYKKNYATFKKRGMLYKSMTEEFDDVCGVMSSELSDEWERAANKEDIYRLIHLQ